jgi:Tol biopolymer transport system component
LLDVTNGAETLIADQPDEGLTHCGSPAWSHDGRRILFDASPGARFGLTHLKSIEPGEGRPTVTDLGTGNCPTLSPADDRIAFLSNANGVESGVWLMNADGSERRLLGAYGRPKWSADGRQLMMVSFSNPRHLTIMDANSANSGVVQLADHQFFADPTWAGPGTIVAVIGATAGDAVALIDVSNPSKATVKEVLWRRANGPDVTPDFPVYSAATRRSVFIGGKAKIMAPYSVKQGETGPAQRLAEGSESWISDLAFSPDGLYVLYIVHGPHRTCGGKAPGGRDAAKARDTDSR